MIEQLITDLIAALNANTAALKGASVSAPVAEPAKKTRTPKAETPKTEEPKPETPAPASEPEAPKPPVTSVEVVPPTLEDLRAVGAKLVAAGKGDKLKAILEEYQVSKLSALPAQVYPSALAKFTAALNA